MTVPSNTPASASASKPKDVVEAEDKRERFNRRAQELATQMRAEDPRLTGNPYGPYAARLQEVVDAGGVPELVEALRADLLARQRVFVDQLAALPEQRDDIEITRRAGVILMLDCIAESLTTLKRLFF